nr:hypothetical protein [Planctomycetota bacterium]
MGGDWYVVGPVTVKMIDPKPLRGAEAIAAADWTYVAKKDAQGETVQELAGIDPRE